jgi:2,3-bisphosphoglycerate-independent phosphoglycerate mutase
MVGHTGIIPAAVKAVETVDTCVGSLAEAVKEMDGVLFVTADHGNADKMLDENGEPFTAHTTNPVPFIVYNYDCKVKDGGRLCDIAPTMLKVMGLEQPKEMTGESIVL